MIKYTGKGVYGAVAIGKVSVFKRQTASVEKVRITDPEAEKARVTAAKEKATEQLVNAEFAVASARDTFAAQFSAMDDSYFQARAADIKDISDRLLNCLADNGASSELAGDKMVVCSDDLAPSETVSLDKSKVLARFRDRLRIIQFPYCDPRT